jgi:DNA ligase-associated metallophosphoesterase
MTHFHPDLTLLPEGAAFVDSERILIVADVHLGKSATFRARGVPVPEGDTARDLQRLRELVRKSGAARVVIAGDLFHAPAGVTVELEAELAGFLAELGVPVSLVAGNHDRWLAAFPGSLEGLPHLDLGSSMRVIHDPQDAAGGQLHIAGHWHPVVRISDGRRRSLRMPCFLLRGTTLVLPAFGSFTGGAIVKQAPNDRIFVAHDGCVIELPGQLIL